jgi:hypothetical protein
MNTMAAVRGMDDYTLRAKAYWWTTSLVGAAALGLALLNVAQFDSAVVLQVVGGTTVAALTGLFPERIPGTKTSLAGAELFIFLLLLVHGPAAATIAAAAEAAVGSYRTSKRWTSRVGSPTMAALAMYGCGSAFALAIDAMRNEGVLGSSWLFAGLLIFAFGYFACNALLMTTLIALKQGEPVDVRRILSANSWIGFAYLASASNAGLVYVSFERFGTPVLLATLPILALFLVTIHARFRRTEAAEGQVAELQEREARGAHSAGQRRTGDAARPHDHGIDRDRIVEARAPGRFRFAAGAHSRDAEGPGVEVRHPIPLPAHDRPRSRGFPERLVVQRRALDRAHGIRRCWRDAGARYSLGANAAEGA